MNIAHWTNTRNDSPSKFNRQSSETLPLLRKKIHKRNQQSSIDNTFQQLYKHQKLAEIVNKAKMSNTSIYEEYDEIKVQGTNIKLKDHVIIKNGDNRSEDYIGSIEKICSVIEPITQKLICLVQVKWFMRKSEIISQKPRARSWIGTQEVFSTKTNDYILAQTIIQKCTIISCDEYQNIENCDSTTYFSRLEWDVQNRRFTNIDELPLYCLCQQPWNPELNYIQCDKCQNWYHFECVNLKDGEYERQEYICGYCHKN